MKTESKIARYRCITYLGTASLDVRGPVISDTRLDLLLSYVPRWLHP
jgi:hypothetical protein